MQKEKEEKEIKDCSEITEYLSVKRRLCMLEAKQYAKKCEQLKQEDMNLLFSDRKYENRHYMLIEQIKNAEQKNHDLMAIVNFITELQQQLMQIQ